jgi:hypothetical protein
MSTEQYWTGKRIDLRSVWKDYDGGSGYIEKVRGRDLFMLRLNFTEPGTLDPLFAHEAIYLSVKSLFHDLKEDCLSEPEYNSAVPIFLHRVDRGSGIYEFLAELQPLLMFATALATGILSYRPLVHHDIEITEKKLTLLQSYFPLASRTDVMAYLSAKTPWGRNKVIKRLVEEQGLASVQISNRPLNDGGDDRAALVDVARVIESERGMLHGEGETAV